MTMIRINLIAEKKAVPARAAKKTARKPNELQENLILIVCVLVAVGVGYFLWQKVRNEMETRLAEKSRLQKEYDSVKEWETKQEEYEIRKMLLNEKIKKISELKDNREGPVKLMEDVANVLPESVWLGSVAQGYANDLVKPTGKGRTAFKPAGTNLGDPTLIRITGFARTTDAITNFARKIRGLDARYVQTDLNSFDKQDVAGQYEFQIFFKIRNKPVARGENDDLPADSN